MNISIDTTALDIIVDVKSLSKQYDIPNGIKAVREINFDIKKGEIFSLLGPNGSGKTSTIGMLSGLLRPTTGDAIINGYSIVKKPRKAKRHLGVVPQDIALYSGLSAFENLVFWAKIYGLNRKQRKKRIPEVLEISGLTDRSKEKVETFSGGMQRRLNIAVGIIHEPELIYMDEPTVGIDPQSRRKILDTIKELNRQGMTVLYTTHYMEEAEELSHRIGIIDRGELIAVGRQSELTHQVGIYNSINFNLLNSCNDLDIVSSRISNLDDVRIAYTDTNSLIVETKDVNKTLPQAIRYLSDADFSIKDLSIIEPNLESLFLHMTGRALRD